MRKMLTIRKLAERYGLCRATLLYYDRIGLLRPSSRTQRGYRLYGPDQEARLADICRYRESGMKLSEIEKIVGNASSRVANALERRLSELNREIGALRRQQQVVVKLLAAQSAEPSSRVMDKEKWVALLSSVGLDEGDRDRWHAAFERLSPEAHQDFLESLGLPEEDISAIRAQSAAFESQQEVRTGQRAQSRPTKSE